MVWLGLGRKDAAHYAGLVEHSLYVALRLPHVKAWYLAQLEVLRTSERAKSLHRLLELRDGKNGQVAIQAIRTLERMDDEADRKPAAAQHGPGLQIVIMQGDRGQVIDAKAVPAEGASADED